MSRYTADLPMHGIDLVNGRQLPGEYAQENHTYTSEYLHHSALKYFNPLPFRSSLLDSLIVVTPLMIHYSGWSSLRLSKMLSKTMTL